MARRERRVPLPHHEPRSIRGVYPRRVVDLSRVIDVTIVVPSKGPADEWTALVAAAVTEPPQQRNYLTRAAFGRRWGASPQVLAKVSAFGEEYGLKTVDSSAWRRCVVLRGTLADFQDAFSVTFAGVDLPNGTFLSNEANPQVPVSLAPLIEAVLGLDNIPSARPHLRPRGRRGSAMFNLPELRSAYRFPPRLSGSGQCVAVIELGGGLYPKDYIEYFRTIGIPPPPLRKRTLPRAGNEPSSVEDMEELLKSIWDGDFPPPPGEIDYGALWTWETAMDLEIIGTLAPKATLLLMQGVFDDQGQYHAITSALADARNAPSVISCSWGFFEADTTPIFMPVIDRWMQSAAVLGVTACFSTGDYGDGSLGETGNDPVTLEAMFPATSPYALACGGTTLDIRAGTETAWFQRINGSAPMAAGGGFSQEFPLPAWQSDIDPDSFIPAGASSGKGRAVPDVVSRSNLDPAFSVIAAGLPFPVGGTSASAPLWAALVALLNQGLRRPTGSLNALLYDDQGLSDTFRDIVRGKIGHLRARRGWDPASGWGSPDGEAILQALRRYNR